MDVIDFKILKLSKKIKSLRLDKNFSQEHLASKARISRKALIDIEASKVTPSIHTLVYLSEALSYDLIEYFTKIQNPINSIRFLANDIEV